LHEGVKRCEGTSTLYTVGCQGSLRAARPESVTALFKRVGVKLVYLPIYLPDLNPIKEFFSKLKEFI